ncbi:MAG: SDR family NAD(P)-dependent oxidoreductase, partial [Betaproteobacteria bacterium]|nr:SDR family NAD(P)-dependent oxidoreductase [Betaproteobacteria bacterium]
MFAPLNAPFTSRRGTRVWVVGASSGIGAALAEALRAEGARVAVSARSAQGLQGELVLP